MEKLKCCTKCGEWKPLSEFTKRTSSPDGHDKWCRVCHAKACRATRARHGIPERPVSKFASAEISEWRCYVEQHGNTKEAAEHFNIYPGTMRKHTADSLRKYKENREALILQMRSEKKTNDEIAELLGCSSAIVGVICRKHGAGGRIRHGGGLGRASEETRQKILDTWRNNSEAKYAEILDSAGLDYISGYTHSDGMVTVRCRDCGRTFEITCQRIRKGQARCDLCEADRLNEQKLRRAEEKRAQEEAEKAEREAERLRKKQAQEAERQAKRNRICKECGTPFVSSHEVYCSDRCRRKAGNRQREARRRGYKSAIPLALLYKRDNGVCYICGCQCSYKDYSIVDEAFIVGPTYPTVEHVIPLSKGGPDSWDNVRLACHRCNTKKSINSLLKVERTGQISLML